MKIVPFVLCLLLAPAAWSQAQLFDSGELAGVVSVSGVDAGDDVVNITLVNESPQRLSSVRLLILDRFEWSDELNPGDESPSRAEVHVATVELAPGEATAVQYTRESPLPSRDDGTFTTEVQVLGVMLVEDAPAPTP